MTRRERREHIFKMLFLKEFHSEQEIKEQVVLYLNELEQEIEESQIDEMTQTLIEMTAKIEELDKKINGVAKGWKTTRMSKVDLTLIRLALYEILYDDSVPAKVAINEAVELAKSYGGNDSASFINGILGQLVRVD